MTVGADERYVVISADCHAGGSHRTYREYSSRRSSDEFDAWRGEYSQPVPGPAGRRPRPQLGRRAPHRRAGGRRPGRRGHLPQHGAAVLPDRRARRPAAAARRTHRRLGRAARPQPLAGRLVQPAPDRRAGIAQIFLNDVDDAVAEVEWMQPTHGLRGGVLLPGRPRRLPTSTPLYSEHYDPLWAVVRGARRGRQPPLRQRPPRLRRPPGSTVMWAIETAWYRPPAALAAAHRRRVRALPEAASSCSPSRAARGCRDAAAARRVPHGGVESGRIGELKLERRPALPLTPSEYFDRNVWVGASFPGPRGRGHAQDRPRTGSCGAATTRTTRAARRSRRELPAPLVPRLDARGPRPGAHRAPRPTSTASTWRSSRVGRPRSVRPSPSCRCRSRRSRRARPAPGSTSDRVPRPSLDGRHRGGGRAPIRCWRAHRHGRPVAPPARDPDGPFGALVRAIVFQQLAGAAASAIHGRVRAHGRRTAHAGGVLAARPDEALRGAGCRRTSWRRCATCRPRCSTATVVLDARVAARRRRDVARLTTVRGIGRWTAEMYLMFELRRLDVWPVDDLGVRQGYGLAWRLDRRRRPRSWSRSASASARTARSSPATAGRRWRSEGGRDGDGAALSRRRHGSGSLGTSKYSW